MSSILRALKKLENEPRHSEEHQTLDSKFVPLADTGPERRQPGIIFMVIGAGVVSGLVILAGWWLLSEKLQTAPALPPAVSEQTSMPREVLPVQAASTPPATTPAERTEIPTGVKPPDAPDDADRTAKLSPEQLLSQPEKVSVPTSPKEISQSAESALAETEKRLIPEQSQIMEPVLPTEQPVATETVVEEPVPAETVEEEIPKLVDRDMKLQAVTWSKEPQNRVAVINNRILREGEAVSGYIVGRINQDDVILSKNGNRWKLLFRIK